MSPGDGHRSFRVALHAIADALTAHGFEAHAECEGRLARTDQGLVPLLRHGQTAPRCHLRRRPRPGARHAFGSLRGRRQPDGILSELSATTPASPWFDPQVTEAGRDGRALGPGGRTATPPRWSFNIRSGLSGPRLHVSASTSWHWRRCSKWIDAQPTRVGSTPKAAWPGAALEEAFRGRVAALLGNKARGRAR